MMADGDRAKSLDESVKKLQRADSIVSLPPYFRHLRPSIGHLPTILLFRHAEREHIQAGTDLTEALSKYNLTEQGKKNAENFGAFLKKSVPDIELELAVSSPVERCLETIRYFLKGMEREDLNEEIKKDPILVGKDLITPESGQQMINNREKYYLEAVRGEFPVGDHSFKEAGKKLAQFLAGKLKELSDKPMSLGVACSHDFVMGLIVGSFFKKDKDFQLEDLPQLMECILIQKSAFADVIALEFRDQSVTVPV